MPKYQAVNYLTEALKKRHALLERMLLLPPQHLEHVDSYIHKGDVPDSCYVCPWKSEFECVSTSGRLGDEQVQGTGGDVISCEIFDGLNVDESCLEFYDVSNGMGNADSTVIDDSISVEIELAMEKAGIGVYYAKEEEFNLEILDTWNNTLIEADGGYWILEEVEETKPLYKLLDDIPIVDQLCSRLKPKMVQDPLQGDHVNHLVVFRCDRHMTNDDDGNMDTTNPLMDKEHFNKENLLLVDQDDEEIDKKCLVGFLEEPDVFGCNNDIMMNLPQLEASPCSDHETVLPVDLASMMDDSEEYGLQPISPPAPLLDFIHLNDQLSSGTDSDSGMNLLESPCAVGVAWTTPTIDVLNQLHRLEPFPLSPDWNRTTTIMSSKEKEKVIEEMWQKEKMFDELLALILQVPDTSNELTLESIYVTTVRMISPSHLPPDTNMELEMEWDPLCATSHDQFVATQSSLLHLLHYPSVSSCPWDNYQEKFSVEPSLFNIIVDDDDHQLSITCLPGGGVALQQYDLPRPLKASSLNPSMVNGNSSSGRKNRLIPGNITNKPLDTNFSLFSSLDEFISMRTAVKSSSLKPLSQLCQVESNDDDDDDDMECGDSDGASKKDSQMIEVTLSGQYTSVLEHIEKAVTHTVNSICQIEPSFSYSRYNLTINQAKQLLKQSAPSPDCDSDDARLLELYGLAVKLFLYCCVVDLLLHCSAAVSMSELMNLLEQYSDIVGRDMEPLREQMATLLIRLRERGEVHPKMKELRNIMCRWVTKCDGNRKKAIVVLEREFSSLSGEILDTFQSIRGLSACVHSWTSGVDGMGEHQDAIEDRFLYYDCLVVPKSSMIGQFPWHRVNLLVEYEHTGDTLHLAVMSIEHIVLKCNSDVFPGLAGSPVNQISQDGQQLSVSICQYRFIGSHTLIQNGELLRLLETKHNITILEREYSTVTVKGKHSIATADVIVDARTGIILRPVSQLEDTLGLKKIVNLTYSLSTQYELLWIILYSTPTDSYPYAGNVSGNISRLHASFAHFDVSKDEFQTRIICVNSYTDVADKIRNIGELAHQSDVVWGADAWYDRSWLSIDISKHEGFLLSFPCVNAFSAQVMLAVCSLRELLTVSLHELISTIPWVPAKVLKSFHLMVNYCKYSDTSITEGSDDVDHVTATTTVTSRHQDELVCDSLSETEHSPFNHEQNFYSSFFQHTSTKEKSPLFTTTPSNGLSKDNITLDESGQVLGSQSIYTPRSKIPLKAVDLDSSDIKHFLQINDRSMVRNITLGGVVSGYASREKSLICNVNHLDAPTDHHINWISN